MSLSAQSILFLSGAGLPAWVWDGVRAELVDHYRTQVAPRPGGAASLQGYAEAALGCVPTEGFIVVAHSAGGVVAAELAGLAPQRVTGILAVSAIIPEPGGSFLSALPRPHRWILGIAMRLAGTRPPESAIRQSLAHGLDDRTVDRLIADFTPEPSSFYRDRTRAASWNGPCTYLTTTNDRELPVKLQHRFAARLGAPATDTLATGHLPMLEDPTAVARAITRFAERTPAGR